MSEKQKIINIAVIAYVDAGKSTLVDAFLNWSEVGRRTIAGKFLVDVRERGLAHQYKYATDNKALNKELAKNPHKFYKKYHKPKEEAS